ncbi:MAG: adenylate/guanylate cyclase domain-containing protein [Proteobacteria bacterium]|nr:adenylate/guanylate cyclase domain-containing protein [Pseudomonadota bacterium]
MIWKLRIKDHKTNITSNVELDSALLQIGRDPNCDVVLPHDRVSRRHVELRANATDDATVLDLSSNGTFVRRREEWIRIDDSLEICPPCTLRIAHFTIKIEEVVLGKSVQEVAEQTWDQSVMIPVASLGQRTEAILVFDLCESSFIANKDDHMAYHMKQRLTQIAEPILEEYGRRFFKSTGDGFLATFEQPDKALQAAIKVEHHIQMRNQRTTNEPIHYRIALHYGDVWAISVGGEDVHGNDINVTFRIEGLQASSFAETKVLFPKQDRILCSKRFYDCIENHPVSTQVENVHCGAAALKGIVDVVDIDWLKTKYSPEDLDSTLAMRAE